MIAIQIAPATQQRSKDVLELFKGSGDRDCWCQYWRQSASAYRNSTRGLGKTNLLAQIQDGPPPGILGYVDGKAVGWVGLWPRERLERLVRSRTIPKIDDQPVWSIVCFKIQVGY